MIFQCLIFKITGIVGGKDMSQIFATIIFIAMFIMIIIEKWKIIDNSDIKEVKR